MAPRPACLRMSHLHTPWLPGATEGVWPFPVGTLGTLSCVLLEQGPQGGVLLRTPGPLSQSVPLSLGLMAPAQTSGRGMCPLVPLNFLMCLSSS